MNRTTQNERTIEVGEYCLLYVDILNQKRELEEIRRLPRSEEEREKFIASLRTVIGKIDTNRRLFDDFFNSCLEYKPPNDPGVSEDIYQQMTNLMRADISSQRFSDTLIYYAAMWPYTGNNPVVALHSLISACAATFINTLSGGIVCRGSLDIGIAGQFFEGEIYGPALAQVYELESKRADYPRIVVGDQLFLFLKDVANLQGEALEITHNRSMAASCIGLISKDDDGVRIIDYLGAEARKMFPYAQNLIAGAIGVATQELTRFDRNGDAKLARRYERLLSYLTNRRDQFWK